MQSALWQLIINLIFRISNLLKLVGIIYSFPGLYKGIGRHYSVCVSWSVWMSIIVLWKRMEDNGFIRKHQNELNFCRSTKKMECWSIPRVFNKFSLFKYINCGKNFLGDFRKFIAISIPSNSIENLIRWLRLSAMINL